MSLPESEPAIDDELADGLRGVGRALDASSDPLDGPSIRSLTASRSDRKVVALASKRRRRSLFLTVAAALAVLVATVAVINRSSDPTSVVVGPADGTAENEEAQEVEGVEVPEEEEPTAPSTTVTPVTTVAPARQEMDFLPRSVTPAEVGPAEARWLPPIESGLKASDVSQVLSSEMEQTPPPAEPVRVQSASMPSTDPNDRRSISLMAWHYADAVDAEAILEDEPVVSGLVAEDPIDLEGRFGSWSEEPQISAPYSGGEPKYDLGLARVLIEPNIVLGVVGPNLLRSDAEAIIAGAVVAEDGSVEFTVQPAGFDEPVASAGRSVTWLPVADDVAIDYIDMTLRDDGDLPMNVVVVAGKSDLMDGAEATVQGDNGYGWVSYGLFREVIATWVTPDVAITLTDFSGSRTGEELLALAQQFEPVDEATWVERLADASTQHTPIWEK